MSEPRTIWTCAHLGEYGQYFPEAVEAEGEYGGTAVRYHHDAVVRELVEALEEMVAVHGVAIRNVEMLARHNRARRLADAALAKIAQEGKP